MKGSYIKYKDDRGILCTDKVVNDIYLVEGKPFVYIASAEQISLNNILEVSNKEIILPEVYYSVECGGAEFDPAGYSEFNYEYKKLFSIVSKDIEKVKMFLGLERGLSFMVSNTIEHVEVAKYKRLYPEEDEFKGICIEKENLIKHYTSVKDQAIKDFIDEVRFKRGF